MLRKQRQELLDILLAKCHLISIEYKAGDTHDLIALLQLLKMGKIVYFSCHLRIEGCDVLRRYHEIRTHGAGKGHQHLHCYRFIQCSNGLPCCFIQRLTRPCCIVQPQHEGGELMPAGDAVKGQPGRRAILQADTYARSLL